MKTKVSKETVVHIKDKIPMSLNIVCDRRKTMTDQYYSCSTTNRRVANLHKQQPNIQIATKLFSANLEDKAISDNVYDFSRFQQYSFGMTVSSIYRAQ